MYSHRGRNGFSPDKLFPVPSHNSFLDQRSRTVISQEPFLYNVRTLSSVHGVDKNRAASSVGHWSVRLSSTGHTQLVVDSGRDANIESDLLLRHWVATQVKLGSHETRQDDGSTHVQHLLHCITSPHRKKVQSNSQNTRDKRAVSTVTCCIHIDGPISSASY